MNVQVTPFGATGASATGLAPPMRTSAVQADIVKPANMATLPQDPYNMLAQFAGVGYQPAAFDPTGSNNGYYGNATYIRSPLMQKYLQPTAMNTQAWVTNGLQNAMPGWNSVSTPGQNPYYTASQEPSPLFPTNTQFAGAVNPTDLPGVNGNPYTSMWNQQIGAQQPQAPVQTGIGQAPTQSPTQSPVGQYSPNMQASMQQGGQAAPGNTTITMNELLAGQYNPASASAQSQGSQDWLAKYLGAGNAYANGATMGGSTGQLAKNWQEAMQNLAMRQAAGGMRTGRSPNTQPPPGLQQRMASQRINAQRGLLG